MPRPLATMLGSRKVPPEALRWARKKLDLSLAELGELIGVHKNTVWRWEQPLEEGGGAPKHMAFVLPGVFLWRGRIELALSCFRQGELFEEDGSTPWEEEEEGRKVG